MITHDSLKSLCRLIYFAPFKVFNFFGVDKTVLSALLARGWPIISGPINLLIISHLFSPQEQGYYYTFFSVLMLQIFFELGLSYVVLQIISHEFAILVSSHSEFVKGPEPAVRRFKQIVFVVIKWYLCSSALTIFSIIPIGIFFFNKHTSATNNDINWLTPWILLAIFTGLNVLLSPIYAIIEGSGQMREINKLRIIQTIIGNCIGWTIAFTGGGLFITTATSAIPPIIGLIWLFSKKKFFVRFLIDCFRQRKHLFDTILFDWKSEMWPLQWKIALSWISGYFIFHLYNPVLFYYHGPVIAGKMGMTLSIANAISQISVAWVYVRIPQFGVFIANKNWTDLDLLFNQSIFKSSIFIIISATLALLTIWHLQYFTSWGNRFLAHQEAALLLGSIVLNHLIGSLAIYLRAHKDDPLVVVSIIGATLMSISIWVTGRSYSSLGVVTSSFIIDLLYGLPTTYWLWIHFRRKWHADNKSAV